MTRRARGRHPRRRAAVVRAHPEIRDWLAGARRRAGHAARDPRLRAAPDRAARPRAGRLAARPRRRWRRDRPARTRPPGQRRAPWPRSVLAGWQGGARRRVPRPRPRGDRAAASRCGRRLLRDVELDPVGFVAPGYAYTRALRDGAGRSRLSWFADLRCDRHALARPRSAPRRCAWATRRRSSAPLSPAVVRAAARAARPS